MASSSNATAVTKRVRPPLAVWSALAASFRECAHDPDMLRASLCKLRASRTYLSFHAANWKPTFDPSSTRDDYLSEVEAVEARLGVSLEATYIDPAVMRVVPWPRKGEAMMHASALQGVWDAIPIWAARAHPCTMQLRESEIRWLQSHGFSAMSALGEDTRRTIARKDALQSLLCRIYADCCMLLTDPTVWQSVRPGAGGGDLRELVRTETDADPFMPANYFSKTIQGRLKHAVRSKNGKPPRVRREGTGRSVRYSLNDAKALWPGDVR